MRLKLDENLGHRWRAMLVAAGHDVDTVHDENLSGAPDPRVLDAAVVAERALVTLDVEFGDPFRFPPSQTLGIAVLRVTDRPGRSDIDLVIEQFVDGLERADIVGHLWIVEPHRIRQFQASDADLLDD